MFADATAGEGLSSPEMLEALFGGFAAFDTIGLAVSGGPDSVAMMHLAHAWRAAMGGAGLPAPELVVITVDHGLRAGSAEEARTVGRWASALGLAHEVLEWQGGKPTAGVQEAARVARYELLTTWAKRQRRDGRVALALAHHIEDQAETVLMRLARGSGTDGLAAMRVRSCHDGVAVLRPLLDLTKAELIGYLEAIGAGWVEDPSNQSPQFERVRLRAERASRARMGLSDRALALTARRAARATDALEWATDGFLAKLMTDQPLWEMGGLVWPRQPGVPEDVVIRGLARALGVCGGTWPDGPELAAVERLAARLACVEFGGATLGRCQIGTFSAGRVIYREVHRCGLPSLTLRLGERRIWDGRFEVSAIATDGMDGGPVMVRGWDEAADAAVRAAGIESGGDADRRELCAGQPVFWSGDRLVGMPTVQGSRAFTRQLDPPPLRCTARFLGRRMIGRD